MVQLHKAMERGIRLTKDTHIDVYAVTAFLFVTDSLFRAFIYIIRRFLISDVNCLVIKTNSSGYGSILLVLCVRR